MSNFYKFSFIILALIFECKTSLAQTPGLIIRDGNGVIPPATRSSVLDPNQDGWSSVTTAGFIGSDIGAAYSEIPYKPIPPL
ncbi:MAG TPA: hypothetical protein VFV31_12310, partial [Chitinophagaceae bacterium]|nr:hypothetical protein [Chitinophagaceae bacterium]